MVSPTPLLSGHSDRGCERGGRFICDGREGGSVPCLPATFKEGAESGGLGSGEFRDMVYSISWLSLSFLPGESIVGRNN